MPNIKRMGKTMTKLKVAPEIMAQMDFDASTKGNNLLPTIAVIEKMDELLTVSKTYCGCCAGHFLYHYQNALGVKLRLKEIVSSPLDSNGEQPCSFTFEVMEG